MNQEQLIDGIIRSGLTLPVIVIAGCVLSNILLFCRFFTRVNEGQPLRKAWLGVILSFLVSMMLFLPILQTLCYTAFLPGESRAQPISGEGTVEENAPFLYRARYHVSGSDEIFRSSCVTVDGAKFFCLNAEALARGDQITFLYYPKSRVIVSFQSDKAAQEAQQPEVNPKYAHLGMKEPLLSAAVFLLSAACAFLLSAKMARKALSKDGCWIRGQLFYRNGLDLWILTAFLSLLAALLIPALREVPFIILLIPLILIQLIRDIPLSYALTERTLSVYLFRSIRIRSAAVDNVRSVLLFQTEEGSLFVLDLSDQEMLSCKSFFAFLRYCRRNRRNLLFLPVAESLTEYAFAEFTDRFGRPQRKAGLLSTFPLR